MRDADGRIRRIDVLTTCSGRAVNVDAQVAFAHVNFHIHGLREDRDSHGGGMHAARVVGHGHTLNTMDSTLKLEPAKDTHP